MATRHERVVVTLDDHFTSGMARAAAATSVYRRELSSADKQTLEFQRTTTSTRPSIDQLSGRLSILARAAAVLGPSFVPITTAAVPAIAGLATELGFAAAAGGTAILAFQGVGEALEAVNKYQLEPTDKNLQKAKEALDKLSPAAQALVGRLDELGPAFRKVRDAASEGMVPGVLDALDDIEELLPRFSGIVNELATATGDSLAAGADSLNSERWTSFFEYLKAEARPVVTTLFESVGDLTHGLGELWMALDPLSDDFTGGLAKAADDFDKWATGLSQTEGFQEFLSYVRTTGPQVIETVESLASAVLQIAEAAAPLGGPVLRGVELFADVIASIADSDLGTPIMAAVSAFSALSLARNSFVSGFGVGGGLLGDTLRANILNPIRDAAAALTEVTSAQDRASMSVDEAAADAAERAEIIHRGVRGFAMASAAVGGLVLAQSGLAEQTGLSNTASMALMGTIAGPWGAAMGGGIGLVRDMAAANDNLEDATTRAYEQFRTQDWEGAAASIAVARDELDKLSKVRNTDLGFGEQLKVGGGQIKNFVEGVFGRSDVEEASARLNKVQDELFDTEKAANQLAIGMGAAFKTNLVKDPLSALTGEAKGFSQVTVDADEMTRVLERAKPAMDRLGISMEDLSNMSDRELTGAIVRIKAELRNMDTDKGRIDAIGSAFANLDSDMESTEEKATDLKGALDALFSPDLKVAEARDNWKSALNTLKDDLDTVTNKDGKEVAGSRSLKGDTEGAITNRGAIRGRVADLLDLAKAQADAGASGKTIAKTLRDGKQAIIDQGEAAGLHKQEIKDYLKQLNLTPKFIKTSLELSGVTRAKRQVELLNGLLDYAAKRRTIVLNVRTQGDAIRSGDRFGDVGPGVHSARGNFLPAKRFAFGGFEDHQPEFAGPGPVRIWREPETGGESYIPHRNDSRRPRAKAIAEQTVALFGGEVRWFARGGMTGSSMAPRAAQSVTVAGLSRSDIDSLAAAVANARPIYGDAHFYGDSSSWKRQMDNDRQAANLSGVRS